MGTERHTFRKPAAFTVVELILVMAIMTVIGLFAAMGIANVRDYAMRKHTESTIRLFEIALEQYKQDISHYPLGTGTNMVTVLTDPTYGWKSAGLGKWFPNRKTLKDAWDQDFAYCSYTQYDSSGRGVERTPGQKDFYNSRTFQIYSMGPNMRTWLTTATGGYDRLCGTEEDDIRNWLQENFYTAIPAAYPQ